MWDHYINAASVDEAVRILAAEGRKARIVAGGTDLLLEIERGARAGVETLVDVTRIEGLDRIELDADGWVHLGPLVTHNHCANSTLIRRYGLPLALASWEVGAPQIRNRSTVAGNIITGSPANDTITPLMALGARVTLSSERGVRTAPFSDFYTGIRKTILAPDEFLTDIAFPALRPEQRGAFIKIGLRRAQAISVVHIALIVSFSTSDPELVERAEVTLGAVTPVIVHATKAEAYLSGRRLEDQAIEAAARLAQDSATPIDDVRGSAAYRREMVRICTLRGLRAIRAGREGQALPSKPINLWGNRDEYNTPKLTRSTRLEEGTELTSIVNGRPIHTRGGSEKSLLRWLREDAGLIGTKEGCMEGECGACTVFLDGAAVMSCLVPAGRAHGAEITTIEGLTRNGRLHPVQQAFVDKGAVQCGYCTPGFIMSAVKLLEERASPNDGELRQAITGNLCRCTGYYKILEAMQAAVPPGS